jgi:hypothetical protein
LYGVNCLVLKSQHLKDIQHSKLEYSFRALPERTNWSTSPGQVKNEGALSAVAIAEAPRNTAASSATNLASDTETAPTSPATTTGAEATLATVSNSNGSPSVQTPGSHIVANGYWCEPSATKFMDKLRAENRSLVTGTLYDMLKRQRKESEKIWERVRSEVIYQLRLKFDFDNLADEYYKMKDDHDKFIALELQKQAEKAAEVAVQSGQPAASESELDGPREESADVESFSDAELDEYLQAEYAEQEERQRAQMAEESDEEELRKILAPRQGASRQRVTVAQNEDGMIMNIDITEIPEIPDEEEEKP